MQNKKRCNIQNSEMYFEDVVDVTRKTGTVQIAAHDTSPSSTKADVWASSLSSMSLDDDDSESLDGSLDEASWVHVDCPFDVEEQILGDSGVGAHYT